MVRADLVVLGAAPIGDEPDDASDAIRPRVQRSCLKANAELRRQHSQARFFDDVPYAGKRLLFHQVTNQHFCLYRNVFSAATCRSSGHLAAGLGTTTAPLGAALAVIHLMRAALPRTPASDVLTQFACLFDVRAVAGDHIGA